MPEDYAAPPLNQIRYAERAVDDETWIKAFLHRMPFGTLATVYEGQPFITTNLYVFDEAAHAIYIHTARVGRMRTNIEFEERVCFSVAKMGRLLPGGEALAFDVEYASVVIFGRAGVVEDDEQKRRALQMLLDKYAPHLRPGRDYRPITDDGLKRTAVYRIQIDSWSAKKNEAEPDFPGAFDYDSGSYTGGKSL
jgi:nitroimidazol reductase NimA-like FMN-containing flavoprotein (pyridoxamine 5'-phosphate oxidase superfamily)